MNRIVEPSSPEVKRVVDGARIFFGGMTGNEKLFAFAPIATGRVDKDGVGEHKLAVAILGEAGYVADVFSDRFPSESDAIEFCIAAHKSMGYAEDTAQAIIMDTMRRSADLREQKSDKIEVKLDIEQIDHAIEALEYFDRHDTDVIDRLRGAREELGYRIEDQPALRR